MTDAMPLAVTQSACYVEAMSTAAIRMMTEFDLSAALMLSTSVGWNQIAADWQRMLLLEPDGCFVAEQNGEIVGTTLCCTFGPVAWLAMVIVREDQRGCGLGRELVRTGLIYAQQQGVRTVRLDATRLGEAVYRKLGFVPQFELVRMGGIVSSKAAAYFRLRVQRRLNSKRSFFWIRPGHAPTGESCYFDSSANGVHGWRFRRRDKSTDFLPHDKDDFQPSSVRCPALNPRPWICSTMP